MITNPESSEKLWNQRYSDDPIGKEVSFFLSEIEDLLPDSGSAVDLAGGNGQNAIWFTRRGFATTLIDISTVALEQALTESKSNGVTLECIHHDLEKYLMPSGRAWDVAFIQLFLDRELIKKIPNSLNDDGLFLFAHPTRINLEKHPHPSERFLLEAGEIYSLADELASMRILKVNEQWRPSGRHEAWLVAQKVN
ncbi:MAG: class I SAM-dependent methyltransferase [Acidimicrobiales bacterium]|jgi:tellurite methyltransferase|nr:class I SAM-dependent methyltransferase [Acidimicrobiales bacterium]